MESLKKFKKKQQHMLDKENSGTDEGWGGLILTHQDVPQE